VECHSRCYDPPWSRPFFSWFPVGSQLIVISSDMGRAKAPLFPRDIDSPGRIQGNIVSPRSCSNPHHDLPTIPPGETASSGIHAYFFASSPNVVIVMPGVALTSLKNASNFDAVRLSPQ
jgi:hypothetical protein